ncbi:hypothetical protein OROGR_009857 [Orobanche gracilis]
MPSQEDVDWADSCLSKEPDTLDNDWNLNSLQAALLETRTPQNNSSPTRRDDSIQQRKMEIFSKVNKADGRTLGETAIDNTTGTTSFVAEQLKSDDDHLNHENTDGDFWSSHKMEDVFLPTYNEGSRDLGVSDPDLNFIFQEFELNQSAEDIFKIWDLDIPSEEDDDLVKQLNKALSEDNSDPISSVSGDESKVLEGLQDDGELDDLISGIADLGLG